MRARDSIRNNLLWVLAAVIGAATIHAITRVVHDTSRRRVAAALVANAVAEEEMSTARHRLEIAGLLALGTPGDPGSAGSGSRASAADLLRRQRFAERCRCRATLPAAGFFAVDLAAGAIDVASDSLVPIDRAALARLARRRAAAPEVEDAVRLHADTHFPAWVAATVVERDGNARPVRVLGLLADRSAMLARLFTRAQSDSGSGRLARLDDRSLEVRDADGSVVHGAVDPARRFRASTTHAVLGGLTVTVALGRWQIASPLIAPIASGQIWHLFFLLLATIITIGFAVRASRREAQLAAARSDFVAAVSHELRMPLAQILLASETLALRRERDDRHRLGLTTSILREARRLGSLVENVLLFSRTGAVALRPMPGRVPVEELFADVRESVELAVEDAGQILDTVPAHELAVTGDRALLRQSLVNLVDNAVKYGGPGKRVTLGARRSPTGAVQLFVEDEGRGIPHAERRRVFEPYERLDRDQRSERTGTGLGLAVVRQIVTASGGRVWIEETSGGGTRAVLEIPEAVEAAAAEPQLVV